MITLKQNQVFRNQNLPEVPLPRIILLTTHVPFWEGKFSGSHRRLHKPSYTFTVFHCWTHMYNQKYRDFHPRGYLSLLATTRHKFSYSQQWNSAELCSMVLSPLIDHQGWYLMTPCTYTHECVVSVHYATTYQFHVSYVMNAIWTNNSWIMDNYVEAYNF